MPIPSGRLPTYQRGQPTGSGLASIHDCSIFVQIARPLRLELSGGLDHKNIQRTGSNDIFLDDTDRTNWLALLEEVCLKWFNWLCHAYCLISNHYHIVVETVEGNCRTICDNSTASVKYFITEIPSGNNSSKVLVHHLGPDVDQLTGRLQMIGLVVDSTDR